MDTETNEVPSVRDTLEAVTEAAKPEVTTPTEPEVKPEIQAKAEPESEVKTEPETKVEAVNEEAEPAKTGEPRHKAPAAWKAGAKERWASLPPDVQEEIYRRERDTAVAIQQGAEGRRFAESFHKAIEPYRAVMAAEGATDPIQTVQNLMQTVTGLRMGTPIQKADIVARIINVYGVDIPTLDSLLSGNSDPKVQQQSELDRLLAERMAPYEQFMRQQQIQQQTQQQQVFQQAASVVEQFAAQNEFLDDPEIANSMADLLEMSANRGRSMTIQQAYDQAVRLHPEISKIVDQRTAAKAAQSVAAAKAASSSVKGSPMGAGPATGDNSIRASLLASMDRV